MNEEEVLFACLNQSATLRPLGLSLLQMLPLKYGMKYLPKSKKQAPKHPNKQH